VSKPLSIDRAVDGNLKPVKDSDGTITALEVSTDTVRVKNLDIAGNISSPLRVDGNIVIDASGDITLDAAGGDIHFSGNGTSYLTWVATGILKMLAALDQDDFLAFEVINSGISVISTNDDSGGNLADLSLVADGDMILDSKNGVFIQKNNGTEFSAANSAYAGMILGYTRIQDNSTNPGTDYITINSSSMTVLQTVAGTNLSINFKVPPSGNVEISCSFWLTASSDGAKFSLSTGTSYAELDETHTYDTDYTIYYDETDHNVHTIRFAVTGLTAGTDTTYYLAGLASGAGVSIRHGRYRTTEEHSPPIILKAIALPATIVTGE
tara:strand:- start:628 stop:1599 length:972 start_codon:yes stop_codon:yes gene_type:complete